MELRRIILATMAILVLTSAQSQVDSLAVADSIMVQDTSQYSSVFRKNFSQRWNMKPHSPLKATLFAAALPGSGQIYNGYKKEGSLFRKYWKVPIVYAGLGTCIYFIQYNTKKYRFYLKEYVASADGDPSTNGTIYPVPSNLEKIQDQYHRWMDVSYMALAGVYLFQIIDANVDAHLFYFDVSRDLSLNIHPSVVYAGQIKPAIGITLGF